MPSTQTDRIDGLTTSVAVKAPCVAASSGALTLSGLQTVSGVALADGDRVLVKDQADTKQNGIYNASVSSWTRALDFDGARDAVPGTLVVVRGLASDVIYKTICSDNPVNPGTSSVTFALAAFGDSSTVGFLQAGTGAVSRTVQSRLRDTIHVTDFAAVGDGATDDTAAVQAAFTAAAGKVIVFPQGLTFLVSSISVSAGTIVQMYGATIKQKVLAANTGSPVFLVTGDNCQFYGGKFDGQKSLQPADGFSDSFDGGGGGKGGSYRCAIKADGVTGLTVRFVEFTAMYGACVATRNVSYLIVEDCYAHDTNLPLAAAYRSAGSLTSVSYQRNTGKNIATGDGVVNADFLYASHYNRAVFAGNKATSIERCLVKVESCSTLTINGNVFDTNTIGDFPAIQVDGADTTQYATIVGNAIFNAQAGIKLSSGTYAAVVISDNSIYQTTGPTQGDAIAVAQAGNINALTISGNIGFNVKRHGIIVNDAVTGLVIEGNNLSGQGTGGTYGLQLSAGTASHNDTVVRGNIFRNFEQSAVGSGTVNFARSAAFVFNNFIFQGNIVNAGGTGNRGVRTAGVDLFANGTFSDNYINGQLELYSASVKYRDNAVTGTVTLPTGTPNVEVARTTNILIGSTNATDVLFSSSAPTTAITATKGSLYMRLDGSSSATRAYINTDGGGQWTAVLTNS